MLDFDLFWFVVNVGQTKAKKHRCWPLSQNWYLKLILVSIWEIRLNVYFCWITSYFEPQSNFVKPKPKIMHFFTISQNSNLNVELDMHLKDKCRCLFLWDFEFIFPLFKFGQTNPRKESCFPLSHNWNLKVYLYTHLRDYHAHLFCEISSYFGCYSRLVKQSSKRFYFSYFLVLKFQSEFSYLFER